MAIWTTIIDEDVRYIVSELEEQLHKLAGTTLLITGAGGFLCSYFLDVIAVLNDEGLNPKCKVIGLDNYRSGVPDRLEHLKHRTDISLINHDVSKKAKFHERIDWLIHGASIASPPFYRRFPLETIDANVNGTRNMLELARNGVRNMLYLSTSEIYGDPDPDFIPTLESYRGNVSCTGPRACYDESKRIGETLCTTYHRLYGTPVNMIRPFNVFGPGQRLDDGRIIPDLISAALKHENIVLFSNGRASRSFCYIRDAIRGMLYVLFSGVNGEPFNIGNDSEEITIGKLAERVCEVAGPPPMTIEYKISQDQNYLIDNPQRRCPNLDKLRSLTKWRPQVNLTEGLTRTLQSYREILR